MRRAARYPRRTVYRQKKNSAIPSVMCFTFTSIAGLMGAYSAFADDYSLMPYAAIPLLLSVIFGSFIRR